MIFAGAIEDRLTRATLIELMKPYWRAVAPWICPLFGAALLFWCSDRVLDATSYVLQLKADTSGISVAFDGATHQLAVGADLKTVKFVRPLPYLHEYQIDGSDATNTGTLDRTYLELIGSTTYYRLQSWLRDEGSYSQWRDLRISASGQLLTQADPAPVEATLQPEFALSVRLRRLEIVPVVEFLESDGSLLQLLINRNSKSFRVTETAPGQPEHELVSRYFPMDPVPPLGELLYIGMRAAGFGLILAVLIAALALVSPKWPRLLNARIPWWTPVAAAVAAVGGVSTYWCLVLYHRLPHIGDAVAYEFQSKVLAGRTVTVPAPPVTVDFLLGFTAMHAGRWFAMYPPGAPALYALGRLAGASWLVGPLLAVATTVLVFLVGRREFGWAVGAIAALLIGSSPFLQLQAGSFLSHTPSIFFNTLALYGTVRYVQDRTFRGAAIAAIGAGGALLTRELDAVAYAIPLAGAVVAWSILRFRRQWLAHFGFAGVCFALCVGLYLLYSRSITGSFTTPVRLLVNSSDHWGFGRGIGFYGQHTPASGIVNADEQLTSLNFFAFGWPYYAVFALMLMPFILWRAKAWDWLHLSVFVSIVLAYVGFYYHGIILGPRYYLGEMTPVSLLTARGFQVLAGGIHSQLAALGRDAPQLRATTVCVALGTALLACNGLFFERRQLAVWGQLWLRPREQLAADLLDRKIPLATPAIVTTSNKGIYLESLAQLNCPRLDCDVVYAYQEQGPSSLRLHQAFAGRNWYRVDDQLNVVPDPIEPAAPHEPQLRAEDLILQAPLQGVVASTIGPDPVGVFNPSGSTDSAGALLTSQEGLLYEDLKLNPQAGTVSIWVQPHWEGADLRGHFIVLAGVPGASLGLAKDGASNLRFILSDGPESSEVGYYVGDWHAGEWHLLTGSWDATQVRLAVDGFTVGRAAVRRRPAQLSGLRIGSENNPNSICDCAVKDLVVGRQSLQSSDQ